MDRTLVALVALIIAIIFTWKDLLGISSAGGFTYIQKYTGFISPGVFAMFISGHVLEKNDRELQLLPV